MSPLDRLDQSIRDWDLLESKFYQAWSAGTLPRAALKSYAAQYGAFISTIPQGWAAHGDHEIAAVERGHIEMWRKFAASLGAEITTAPGNAGVSKLVETSRRLFADPVESIGALYAFEAQQPGTSLTKLSGLRRHYDVGKSGEEYFEIHAEDEDEPRLLRRRFEQLPAAEQDNAATACETMCRELRSTLDSLYEEETPVLPA